MSVVFPMAGQGARLEPFLTPDGAMFIAAAVQPFRRLASQLSWFVLVYLEAQDRAATASSPA